MATNGRLYRLREDKTNSAQARTLAYHMSYLPDLCRAEIRLYPLPKRHLGLFFYSLIVARAGVCREGGFCRGRELLGFETGQGLVLIYRWTAEGAGRMLRVGLQLGLVGLE